MPQRTYAQILGAHPASRREVAQAVERGELRSLNTRAYVLPSGQVISNRAMQQMALRQTSNARTLEERAESRFAETGLRSDYATMAHFIRALQRRDPQFQGMSFHEVRRSEYFQTLWGDWKAVQHRSPQQRLAFLQEYELVTQENGKWET